MFQTHNVEVAEEAERAEAFALLFQHLSEGERQRAVDLALALVEQGEIGGDQILVVRDAAGVAAGTVFCINPGNAGQVWLPRERSDVLRPGVADALLAAALDQLRHAGARFVQTLVPDTDTVCTECLERAGFRRCSSLLTLAHALQSPEDWAVEVRAADSLELQPYPQTHPETFRSTLWQTYVDSLDFPELNGLRNVDEVLEAHRRHGIFHPEQWFLALCGGEPVGVLLLVELEGDEREWELSYLGVVPPWRRRGVGRHLVCAALWRAAQLQADKLIVAVDTRNIPAWTLYAERGFVPQEEQAVYLLIPK